MNFLYTTLGEGKNTAVLFDTGHGNHRKVTTTDHGTARELAYALDAAYTQVSNALWDVAVAYNGTPADARRRLLSVFDRAVGGTMRPTGPAGPACWTLADRLVTRVAEQLTGQPAPVVAAVRRELADACLADLDGVLVGGVLWAEAHRPSYLRLVLNAEMVDWTSTDGTGATRSLSPFFDGLDDHALSLGAAKMSPTDQLPTGYLLSDDGWMVVDQLRDQRSCHDTPGESSARSLFASSGDEYPSLAVVPTHLRAWMAAHRPELLTLYPKVGT